MTRVSIVLFVFLCASPAFADKEDQMDLLQIEVAEGVFTKVPPFLSGLECKGATT